MNKKSIILIGASLTAVLCACSKNDEGSVNMVRSEYIKVYEVSSDKTVDNIQVPFEGATDGKIHILSNVSLQWKYLVNQSKADNDWFKIKSVEETEPGHTVVTYDAGSILDFNSLERREGRLSFSNPSISFGKFLAIRQGYQRQFLEKFDDEPDGNVKITGKQTYITNEYPVLNSDFFDYISFNAWAETENEFLSKNITLDITVSGGQFHTTGLKTYRVNVPIGTAAEKGNLKYLLLMGNGERMSAKTFFTFSTENDDQVFVHIDNFAAYKVTEAEMGYLFEDEEFYDDEQEEWI